MESEYIQCRDNVLSLVVDSRYLYCGSSQGFVYVWEKAGRKRLKRFRAHKDDVTSLATDSVYFYTGSTDGFLKIWNKEDMKADYWKAVKEFSFDKKVRAVNVDSDYIYVGLADGDITLIERNGLGKVGGLRGHKEGITSLINDGENLYSASEDNEIKKWNVKEKEILYTVPVERCPIAIAVDLDYLFAGLENGWILVWRKTDKTPITKFYAHEKDVTALAVDSNYIYSSSFDRTVKVWKKFRWIEKVSFKEHLSEITALAVDLEYLYSGSFDKSIRIYGKMWDPAVKKKDKLLTFPIYSLIVLEKSPTEKVWIRREKNLWKIFYKEKCKTLIEVVKTLAKVENAFFNLCGSIDYENLIMEVACEKNLLEGIKEHFELTQEAVDRLAKMETTEQEKTMLILKDLFKV